MRRNNAGLVVKLAGFRRKIEDPYNKNHFLNIEAFVPKPTKEAPLPCIILSIRNGHQRLFFRVVSLKKLRQAFSIPRDAARRISLALISANVEADNIERGNQLLYQLRRLPAGTQIVRADTGEILAVAERILDDNRYR